MAALRQTPPPPDGDKSTRKQVAEAQQRESKRMKDWSAAAATRSKRAKNYSDDARQDLEGLKRLKRKG